MLFPLAKAKLLVLGPDVVVGSIFILNLYIKMAAARFSALGTFSKSSGRARGTNFEEGQIPMPSNFLYFLVRCRL